MIKRRSFLGFIFRRFLAWGMVVLLSVGLLLILGVIQVWPMLQIVSAVCLGLIGSFFEYDSLPRAMSFQSSFRLELEDASGERYRVGEYGLRKFLWLTRITYCRLGKVHALPLEAFCVSGSEVREALKVRKAVAED